MNFRKHLIVIVLSLLFFNCGSNSGQKKNNFVIKTNTNKGNIANDKTLTLSLSNKRSLPIDSISYSLNHIKITESTSLKGHKLGKHIIEATIYFNNEKQVVSTPITILNSVSPKVYSYKIVKEYPHDITSYTQGLEFFNNNLYESTGQYKTSKLRHIDYKTGKSIKDVDLANEYFGEGLTILNEKIYQLTWQENTGFVYNANTLDLLSSFKYGESKEGWGLCNNGTNIYKSDGTEKIWLLNPETLVEEDYIEVYTNKGKIIGINEMEWIDGKIYANRYQKDGVAIINPENGGVIGVIDFSPLKKKVKQHETLDVLNGIAFNPETKTIFVTGKHWDKLFEVEIVEK